MKAQAQRHSYTRTMCAIAAATVVRYYSQCVSTQLRSKPARGDRCSPLAGICSSQSWTSTGRSFCVCSCDVLVQILPAHNEQRPRPERSEATPLLSHWDCRLPAVALQMGSNVYECYEWCSSCLSSVQLHLNSRPSPDRDTRVILLHQDPKRDHTEP